MTGDTNTLTRRSVVRKTVSLGAATVMAPSFVDVVKGDTASGNVELQATATVPANTSIEITVFEDTNSSGTASRQQTETIPNGTTTTQYDLLQSTTAQGDVVWMEIALSSDGTATPELDTVTLTVPDTATEPTTTEEPATEPTEPQGVYDLWHNPRAFIALFVLGMTAIGSWSKALTIGAWAGYITFVYIALTADGMPIYRNIAIVTLVLSFLGFAFKLIRLEFEGEA